VEPDWARVGPPSYPPPQDRDRDGTNGEGAGEEPREGAGDHIPTPKAVAKYRWPRECAECSWVRATRGPTFGCLEEGDYTIDSWRGCAYGCGPLGGSPFSPWAVRQFSARLRWVVGYMARQPPPVPPLPGVIALGWKEEGPNPNQGEGGRATAHPTKPPSAEELGPLPKRPRLTD
jgi:hypothetical protein